LAKSEIAIVSDEAGTTRDVREVPLDIQGQKFVLLDLAGLRQTESKAEAEGVRRAHQAIDDADIVLWLSAPDLPSAKPPAVSGKLIRVETKSDLLSNGPSSDLAVSSLKGTGLNDLVALLAREADELTGFEPSLVSHERDRQALQAAHCCLAEAQAASDWELVAESLRQTSATLERFIGRLDPERILDRLFANFCIGK
jgi:tRNA modification GTPase